VRAIVLYLIGFISLVYGFHEFWQDRTVDQNAFMIGGTCVAVAAALQVFTDLWRRLSRPRKP
jgi:hypothetical protein